MQSLSIYFYLSFFPSFQWLILSIYQSIIFDLFLSHFRFFIQILFFFLIIKWLLTSTLFTFFTHYPIIYSIAFLLSSLNSIVRDYLISNKIFMSISEYLSFQIVYICICFASYSYMTNPPWNVRLKLIHLLLISNPPVSLTILYSVQLLEATNFVSFLTSNVRIFNVSYQFITRSISIFIIYDKVTTHVSILMAILQHCDRFNLIINNENRTSKIGEIIDN